MAFFEGIYTLSTDLLSFWVPIVYAFKFLMDKDQKKIRTILKFWSVISCYHILALILRGILDENVFPWINIVALGVLGFPPYQIVEKVYDFTLGKIFSQNKQSFLSLEETVTAIFDKNTQKLSKNMQNKTSQKVKGLVGGVLVAAMNSSSRQAQNSRRQRDNSDSDNSDKQD